jgi:hypothetical protein
MLRKNPLVNYQTQKGTDNIKVKAGKNNYSIYMNTYVYIK